MDAQGQNGLLSTFRAPWRSRGVSAIVFSAALIAFYLTLYFTEVLQKPAESLGLRNKWYLYGFVYCLGMIGGAIYYLRRHGNSRYNRIRIGVNVGVQILFGFTLPFVMPLFSQPEFYFSYFWPLKYDYLYPQTLVSLPSYLAVYTVVGALFLSPWLAYRFGKRWYCSWVCGCGGLANTFGDPFRHLTSSSTKSWKWETRLLYPTLVFALLATLLMLGDFFLGERWQGLHQIVAGGPYISFSVFSFQLSVKGVYGFFVGSILSGVIGTGVYPLLGPRVWCRNFCPMAAILGLVQKIGHFQIRVKDDMCISCGNCTTYCEMGIDVRAYAERNESFTQASCVGCGMCAHVCPRGVLRLENGRKHLNTL